MKGCEYCRKVNNKPIIDEEGSWSKVTVKISVWKKPLKAMMIADGEYDGGYGYIQEGSAAINFCPMCGVSLREETE